jgi:small-conductance mechanosensitive channel
MLGYVALGRFVAHQLVLTGMVLGVCGLAYLAIRALTRVRSDGRYSMADVFERKLGLDLGRQRQLARLAEFSLTFALMLAALPVLLLQWGFQAADIRDWAKSAVFGFEVGHLRISLARILIGIVLFTGLLFLTRMLQKWLREGVLTQTRMDAGISNSIDQAVGYSGIAIAALIALSYAGFDITSLAIVAGALSVGIGFGLQSIVNNFVSGLILLVERPIKVGDWIALGDQQGNVRRISVRSTEIETFDKASLIVPNSELISGRVLNWTHRNLLGRVVIKFSLDGNADPEKVIAIMMACARAHPLVMKSPEPIATLDLFSPTGLDFSLRATINDVNRGLSVLTDVRVALLKELRATGQIQNAQSTAVPATVSAG